jgi:FkbM family methyltransferase
MIRKIFVNIIACILSRRTLWRFGRALYMKGRADTINIMSTNGEKYIQYCVLKNLIDIDEKIIFFDIGANIGNWTISAMDIADKLGVIKNLEIHLFEPVFSTFITLQNNIKKYQKQNTSVYLINQGLSNIEGKYDMFITDENAGTNSLYQDPMKAENYRIKVELTTGDNYCNRNGINKIHFIKCDTEGNDINVLYGIRGLINSEKVLIFQFEYSHRWIYSRHYIRDVFNFTNTHNYKIAKITPGKIEIYRNWHPELEKFFEGNYLIIHNNVLKWFNFTVGDFDIYDTYRILNK